MSQAHVDRVISDFSQGAVVPVTLGDLGLSFNALVNLPDEYVFMPDGSYCPQSDVPQWVENLGVGVHINGNQACIAVDNGLCLAVWLLQR